MKIVDNVRENNGTVKIFSSLHVSGERKLTNKKTLLLIHSVVSIVTQKLL